MPDNRAEALTPPAPSPVLTIPDALATEATAMLLGGNVDGIKAVQEKLAQALAGQGVSGDAAGTLADGWVRSFAEGVGAASTPDAAIAEAGRQMTGTAERMAQAMQDAAGLTTEQRVAAALAQGQDPSHSLGGDAAAPGLAKALFAGVMDQMARPAGSADPVAALSRALIDAPEAAAPVAPVALSPAEKLTSALASGVAVSDAVKAVGPDASGVFAQSLERALSSGGDVTASITTAAEEAAHGAAQTQAVAVEQSGGERLLTALAAGGAEAARSMGGAGEGAAFAGVLGDALARGAAPDAALDRSVKAQADTAAMVNGAEVAPKPTDALVASLASGRNVAETVKSFAAAAGVDPSSAGGFGHALGAALSSGTDAAGALGTAQQDSSAATAMMVASAQGVKGDPLSTALASGQNVEQSLQAVGGTGVFGNALAQALSEGRSMGQALASARQAADIAQQNSEFAAVAVSAENKALADLAAPKAEEAPKDKAETQVAEHSESKSDAKAEAPAEGKEAAKADPEATGEKAAEEDGKDAGKGEAKAEARAAEGGKAESGEPAAKESSPSADKPFGMDSAALKAVGFAPPDSAVKAAAPADQSGQSASSGTTLASTAPVTKTTSSSDAFATAAAVQQAMKALESTKTVERIVEAVNAGTTPVTTSPVTPETVHPRAPVVATDYDAAALAKALAIAENTAAPAGFTVFHLIETMFRAGETGSSVVGVAVVANAGSALGVWQYSVDGSTWLEVGTVGDGAALVLAGSAMLRFLANEGASGTAPSLGLRAVNDSWTEGFTGGGKTLFALTQTGGTSALSAEVGSLALLVTPVNDAPVSSGTAVVLESIVEDSADPSGATVSSLFAALFSDPKDAVNGLSGDQFAGVVVVGDASTAAQGVWQYWTGSAWAAVGSVSESSGLLLAADAKLRFLPAADWNGTTPALTVRLVEDSSGAVTTGAHADLSAGVGLTTRYSAEAIALTQVVTSVNDAPVATGTAATLAATPEDSADPSGATVSSLFAALFSDAKDAVGGSSGDTLAGIAIVGDGSSSAQGVWQYWNGSAWVAVGAVSEGSALVVTAADKLRFVPSPDWHGEVPALTVRLIDSSAGALASGGRIDLGSLGVGGVTPYSATTIALATSVTAVNDAPVSSGTAVTLATIAEDSANPAGDTVSSLFAALFSDPKDAVNGLSGDQFAGVVVVGDASTAAQGVWQYWTGSAWTAVGSVSESSGLLLAADAKLRFLPAADWNGTTPALTVRLVDGSSGALTTGGHADVPGGGGLTTRYSAETIALTQVVTAVNDAPVALGGTASLTAIAEDTLNPAGQTVSAVFAALFSDAKDAVAGGSSANAFAGIAIVGNAAAAGQGVWQYWNGSAWTAVGAVSEGSALLVKAADSLRFVPAADWNGTAPALTVRLIDGSGGTIATGGHANLTAGVGGSTAYSATTVELTETVTPVNDAPHVTAATASLSTVKGIAVAVTGLSVSDIDAGTTPLLVTLTVGHGTLTLNDGGLDAVITGNGTDSVTVRATLGVVNSLLAANNGLLYTSASSFTGADSLTVLVDDQGGGGAGGALTATGSVALTVVPPNASPVLIDTNLDVSSFGEASALPVGAAGILVSKLVGVNGSGVANVTDSDAGAVTGIALVGANETYGHWWYSTDGGANWALVGSVNDTDSALLLKSTDRLYFQPGASVPETVYGALTIRAWDQTSAAVAGTKVAVDTTAGSAFSTATDTVTLHPGVLVTNGSFDAGVSSHWLSTNAGTTLGLGGDGHQASLSASGGLFLTDLEDFLGLNHGVVAAAFGPSTNPNYELSTGKGNALKMDSTITVTKTSTLYFEWSFAFNDSGYGDFAFVSVNGVVTILAKGASGSGLFHTEIAAGSTISLGFGASDTKDNQASPTLTIDNIRLNTIASDPIVLDMTGDGLSLRPLSDNVHFDVTGDGVADQTGWIGSGNALLARDTNHDGSIGSASELVSENFGAGFNSSLEALASLDTNHDGRIDAQDSDYATLLVWRDNGDGVSQAGELQTLAQAGIQSIATTATASDATLAGNRILGTTSMTMSDGTTHAVAGVAFDVKSASGAVVTTNASATPAADASAQFSAIAGSHGGGTDFAAMLNSGLGLTQGLSQAAPFGQDAAAGGHGAEWMPDPLDPNTNHAQPHDASVHPAAHA